jgi:hypothetical protein
MKQLIITATTLIITALGGAAELDGDQRSERPRIRVASTPYPNPLFRRLATADFGEHHYKSKLWRDQREVSRGHIYTRRGGMIDIAHVRKTVDWAAWLQARISDSLAAGETELSIKCSEPSRYRLAVDFPPEVQSMNADDRTAFERALSIELALVTSYTALVWHEILTWYGYSAVPGLSEQQSAFSFEDMYSHALGITVARRALYDEERDFNAAVTVALREEIKRLDPVDGDATKRALKTVKGNWWRYSRSLKRCADIGETGTLAPWLIPGVSTAAPINQPVPGLYDVNGIDMNGHVGIEIDPVVRARKKILSALPNDDGVVRPYLDYPRIMDDIRAAMVEEYGSDVCDPSSDRQSAGALQSSIAKLWPAK